MRTLSPRAKGRAAAFQLLVVALLLVHAGLRAEGAQGYVFLGTAEQDYAVLDTNTYQILRQGKLWDDVFESAAQRAQFEATFAEALKVVPQLSILYAFPDPRNNRAFLFLSVGALDRGFGLLVVRLDTLKMIALIPRGTDSEWIELAVDPQGRKVYFGHWDAKRETAANPDGKFTVVYDGQTFRELREYTKPELMITPASCFLEAQNQLFARGRLFDILTDTVARQPRQTGVPVNFARGQVLLLEKAADQSMTLIIYDLAADRVATTIRSGMLVPAFIPEEWRLSPDARLVIRDEVTTSPGGPPTTEVRTGRLHVFDVQRGVKVGEVQLALDKPEDSRMLGFSSDGRTLFYRSGNKFYVVDPAGLTVVKELVFTSRPRLILWP